MEEFEEDEIWWDDDDEYHLDEVCPDCRVPYDHIDYEYQICSVCGFNNN